MTDLDSLPPPEPETAVTLVSSDRKCRRHSWAVTVHWDPGVGNVTDGTEHCLICKVVRDPARSRRGRQSRNYGNRAELAIARSHGGTKIGHVGGPVDIRGKDWNTQVKTHRRLPPKEWTSVFAALEASTDRLPRLFLRFVHSTGPTDYIVVPAKAWLDWFGKDE